VVQVQITTEGLQMLAHLDEPVVTLHKKLLGHLTRKELAEINQLMVKARNPE
jgi:DNA-binding MarR family transcriptional regulator